MAASVRLECTCGAVMRANPYYTVYVQRGSFLINTCAQSSPLCVVISMSTFGRCVCLCVCGLNHPLKLSPAWWKCNHS